MDAWRSQSIPAVSSILKARKAGPEAALAETERVLAARLVRGFALWERALALEFLGRWLQVLAAFEEQFAVRDGQPIYVEGARALTAL